jgi:DNA polymerase epsilon subunit 2
VRGDVAWKSGYLVGVMVRVMLEVCRDRQTTVHVKLKVIALWTLSTRRDAVPTRDLPTTNRVNVRNKPNPYKMDSIRKQKDANIFSSSPAFGTPVHPIIPASQRPLAQPAFRPAANAPILPILLPLPTLRPLAFRTFTKKHNLTLNGSALQALATFIGKHCGSGWREEGTGERVLDEVAKLWKNESGPVIVEDSAQLKRILKVLEGCMIGGRIGAIKPKHGISRQSSFAFGSDSAVDLGDGEHRPGLNGRGGSFGISKLNVEDHEDEEEEAITDPRAWIKTISAFTQPRLTYDVEKSHFLPTAAKASFFAAPAEKTAVSRDRYNVIYQRLLRNEAFQAPSYSARRPDSTNQQFYKITPIANLLGRGGSQHLLLGMLDIAPTGMLALNDPTGSISLDLQHAQSMQGPDNAFFCPGMVILVEGQYEEDWAGAGSSGLGNNGGVGGTIGGRFLGFNISGPPAEKRNVSLGIDLKAGDLGGGFGWTDFLGLGSERAVGQRMRRLEQRLLGPDSQHAISETRRKMVVLGEVTLDKPSTLSALRQVLQRYSSSDEEPPVTFVLIGNFTSKAAMANAGTGSIEYKELFNELASVLSDFLPLLRTSTWVFVPGDNDPWASSFSAGASALIPREGIPDIFTSRIKRAFANAKSELGTSIPKDAVDGEAIWTSNPARLSLFGPAHEVAIFRDDMSSRLRRNAIRIGQATRQQTDTAVEAGAAQNGEDDQDGVPTTEDDYDHDYDNIMPDIPPLPSTQQTQGDSYTTAQAKKLVLSLLPQSTLSPFPASIRPTHWSHHSALSLYPLPHALILADADAEPFALTFEGCHVVNPGRLVSGSGKRKKVRWAEYDCWTKRGVVREDSIG